MVADSLVYHPSVAHYLKFVSTTVGRDKLLRTIQYFSRFYAWYLFRTNGTPGEIAPWEAIKKQFGLIRKAMRVCLLSPRNWIKLKSRVVRKKYRAF
jgi:peroxin-11B